MKFLSIFFKRQEVYSREPELEASERKLRAQQLRLARLRREREIFDRRKREAT